MLCQVDLNGHLAALIIGHVLDSGHGFVFLQAGRRRIRHLVVGAPILRRLGDFVIVVPGFTAGCLILAAAFQLQGPACQVTAIATFCYTNRMTKTIAVRIDEELLCAIDRRARRGQRSEIVREALQMWIARRDLAEKVRRHREGYARRPVKPGEFGPVLGAQVWPK